MSTTDREDRRKRGAELGRELADFVNVYSENGFEEFVNEVTTSSHRTVQQSVMRLFLKVVRAHVVNHNTGCFDDRNRATVVLCSEIMKKCKDSTYLPLI